MELFAGQPHETLYIAWFEATLEDWRSWKQLVFTVFSSRWQRGAPGWSWKGGPHPPATKPKCRRWFLGEIGFHSGYNSFLLQRKDNSGSVTATFRDIEKQIHFQRDLAFQCEDNRKDSVVCHEERRSLPALRGQTMRERERGLEQTRQIEHTSPKRRAVAVRVESVNASVQSLQAGSRAQQPRANKVN